MYDEIVQTTMMVIRNNQEEEITIEGYVEYSVDMKYGEDAEYKHGEKRIFIEGISDIEAWDVFGQEITLTKEETEQAEYLLGHKFLM